MHLIPLSLISSTFSLFTGSFLFPSEQASSNIKESLKKAHVNIGSGSIWKTQKFSSKYKWLLFVFQFFTICHLVFIPYAGLLMEISSICTVLTLPLLCASSSPQLHLLFPSQPKSWNDLCTSSIHTQLTWPGLHATCSCPLTLHSRDLLIAQSQWMLTGS